MSEHDEKWISDRAESLSHEMYGYLSFDILMTDSAEKAIREAIARTRKQTLLDAAERFAHQPSFATMTSCRADCPKCQLQKMAAKA